MALQKSTEGGLLDVEGEAFRWTVRRAPQWFNGEWVGLAITVEPAQDPQRVLVIEYPMPPDWKGAGSAARRIARAPIVSDDFPAQIAAALAAGWEPASRGKPFLYLVPAAK